MKLPSWKEIKQYVAGKAVQAPSAPEMRTENTAIGNSSVYKNADFTGGNVQIVNNELIVRAPIRIEYFVDSWREALKAAEVRYYPNRTRLYDIYDDIKLDGHLSGVIQKRLLSVINTGMIYQDAAGEEVEDMNQVIKSSAFRRIMYLIMETQLWGITGIEFLPGETLDFRPIPRKHIKTHTQLISIEQNDQTTGYDYTKLDNVWIIGEPEDLGILNQCCQYVLYKRGGVSDWANFIEIFGMPIRVIKYDPFDPTAEAKLKAMIDETGNLMAMMIPNTATFEIIDGKTGNANGQLQDMFVKAMDAQISIIILGNTETTSNSGTGSQAKSKTHSDQQKEILKADLAYLESKLNDPHFIKILQSYDLPVMEGGRFNIKSEIDINYAAQKVIIDTTLSNAGLPIAENYFYETYDIPKPGAGDKVIKIAPPPPQEDSELNMSDQTLALRPGTPLPVIQKLIRKELNDFFA